MASHGLGGGFDHLAIEEISKSGGKILREAGPMNAGTAIIAFVCDPDGYQIGNEQSIKPPLALSGSCWERKPRIGAELGAIVAHSW